MKLKFNIEYHTQWGESLAVDVEYASSDVRRWHSVLPMTTSDGRLWTLDTASISQRRHPITELRYAYLVLNSQGEVTRREWQIVPRTVPFNPSCEYVMFDLWHETPLLKHLYTKAYATTMHDVRDDAAETTSLPLFRKTLLFRVSAPGLSSSQSVAICGSHPVLGNWNPSRYLKMRYMGQTVWSLTVNAVGMELPVDYKFVVVDERSGQIEAWEEGYNRVLESPMVADEQVSVIDGGIVRLGKSSWKAAGVVIPVFSLRTARSYGIGDFGDLRSMIDWASATGMKLIQLLPLNDTGSLGGWKASCPYNVLSVYALNPIYADLEDAGILADESRMSAYRKRRNKLNLLTAYDYEAVAKLKREYLAELYAEQGQAITSATDFADFVSDNAHWLEAYTAFCLLAEDNATLDRSSWSNLATYDEQAVDHYLAANAARAQFVRFVQYTLHRQLKAAYDYARSRGVVLKGDIPIGVSPLGVDTWTNPELFNEHTKAGVPPDLISPTGQDWGFPTYNWTAMMADDCRWWRRRLAHMEQYFDAARLDHVLGFFRIWAIPDTAVHATLGHFSPSLPLTPDEIESFGLTFRREAFTTPMVNDATLNRIFGMHAHFVSEQYLVRRDYGMFTLRPELATQRDIQAHFAGKDDENSLWIRDGLYSLVANVLFVEDSSRPGTYHPRIGALDTAAFESLADNDREAYTRLYRHYFDERHDAFWAGQARRKLETILRETRMLICAEDLGMLTPSVATVLQSMRILQLCVQTMPKTWGHEFCRLNTYPYLSVATFSTHDMPTLRLWWEEDAERTARYYHSMLQKQGKVPVHLPTYIAEEIIARHLYSPSMLCILSLQDWLSMDKNLRTSHPERERINTPGAPKNQWTYRMDTTIERLMLSDDFNQKVNTMIKRSRR